LGAKAKTNLHNIDRSPVDSRYQAAICQADGSLIFSTFAGLRRQAAPSELVYRAAGAHYNRDVPVQEIRYAGLTVTRAHVMMIL
jgi:hypothetical protein